MAIVGGREGEREEGKDLHSMRQPLPWMGLKQRSARVTFSPGRGREGGRDRGRGRLSSFKYNAIFVPAPRPSLLTFVEHHALFHPLLQGEDGSKVRRSDHVPLPLFPPSLPPSLPPSFPPYLCGAPHLSPSSFVGRGRLGGKEE